jgi:thioredoxin-like negative regulator of GroEL
MIEEIESKDEFEDVVASGTPGLVDFSTEWCAPCKLQERVLRDNEERLKGLFPGLRLYHLDCDKVSRVADKLGIRSIPTLILYDGEEHSMGSGLKSIERIIAFLKRVLG